MKQRKARNRQRGERYGGAIATIDVNGDGVDEIIVGAPLYCKSEDIDVGRILVYYGMNGRQSFEKEVLPDELESYSRFGSSIANIGDIHQDGFEDFVVGAPGAEAVFIFHGCTDFNFSKCWHYIYFH